jgi:dCMP deaminase
MALIIGVTGLLSSGKDEMASYLLTKGFAHLSLSDIVREELARNGESITREALRELGDELRRKSGPGILARLAAGKMQKGRDYVISSIRNPDEISELKKLGAFTLVRVEAPIELRFKRAKDRNRESEKATLEEFRWAEEAETASRNPASQQLHACMKSADKAINNDNSLDHFHTKINVLLEELIMNAKSARPSWDEYFMEVARAIAKRATCDRGKSGCVIAKNKQILSTGYVGSPPGLAHCDEAGHLMKKLVHEDGRTSEHCMRTVHAEQNAICQAAKLGIPIDAATLYCKMTPCRACAMLIISCGIKRVVCEKKYYAGLDSEEIFKDSKVVLEFFDEEVECYDRQ